MSEVGSVSIPSLSAPAISWQKCYSDSGVDFRGENIQLTHDGGYVLCGSNGFGTADFGVVKLSSTGSIQWQKCYSNTGWDAANCIQQTSDGGYIVAGQTHGTVTGGHGGYTDCLVVKLDSAGNIQWQKYYGGSDSDGVTSIQQTSDDGYIFTGYTRSCDGDVAGCHGQFDYWVVKLTNTGDIQWRKCYGSDWDEEPTNIQETTDGGFIVVGYAMTNYGDVTGNHGGEDFWVVKLTSTGDIQWEECLGGSGKDLPTNIQQTSDGGYIVGGSTSSIDGDVVGNHNIPSDFAEDVWVVKLTSTGGIQWNKCLGGSNDERLADIHQTSDGGYIVGGSTSSIDGDVVGNHNVPSDYAEDMWVVKLSPTGGISWKKCYGGKHCDYIYGIQQTSDDGYIISGYIESSDGDMTGVQGGTYWWMGKLAGTSSSPTITSHHRS